MGFWWGFAPTLRLFFHPRVGEGSVYVKGGDKQDKELASLTSLTSMPARDIYREPRLSLRDFLLVFKYNLLILPRP